jgi:predicted O-methyltransferase YrrM
VRRLAAAAAERAPNLVTAMRVFLLLRRQAKALAGAGRDERPVRELAAESDDGAFVEIRDRSIVDFHVSEAPWTAAQKEGELMPFLDRVAALAPRRVCEIGAARAGTLFLLTRVAADDAVIVSIDLDLPLHLRRARARLGRATQRVVALEGDSHDSQVQTRAVDALGGEPLDVLLIDGDHSYDGVRADFELYSPLVRPGGLIAFHDVNPDRDEPGGPWSGDVPRFWAEVRERYRSEELIASPDQSGYGIGIVYP